MNTATDDALELARVREVAAIFHSHDALEDAVEDLLLAGFDRADIDELSDLDEVQKRLGPVYVAHEELADLPQAPRRPAIVTEDIAVTLVVVVSVAASAAGLGAAFAATASGTATAWALIVAVLAALAAGGIAALLTLRVFRPPQSRALEPLMAARGRVLWVRTRSVDREEVARQVLQRHGGQAIRIHEIEIAKRPEEIPLSSLRPDPWLGDGRLGRPLKSTRRLGPDGHIVSRTRWKSPKAR